MTLKEITNYVGICSNTGSSLDADLAFKSDNKLIISSASVGTQTATTKQSSNKYSFTIKCSDYAAYGKIEAELLELNSVAISRKARIIGRYEVYQTSIPLDEDNDKIADSWEKQYLGKIEEYKTIEDITVTSDVDYSYDSNGEGELKNFHCNKGEAITAFDEYRGFIVVDKNKKRSHIRTSPLEKDLFFYNRPYYYPTQGLNDKVPIDVDYYKWLGYNPLFVLNGLFNSNNRIIAYNGASKQKVIRIISDTICSGSPNTLGINLNGTIPGTPMVNGEIRLYHLTLNQFKYTILEKQRVLRHEIGHSVYLQHSLGTGDKCPMWTYIDGSTDFRGYSIGPFCDDCKSKTRAK